MKILLVEDDHDLGSLLSNYLDLQGFSTTLAMNGEEGLTCFSNSEFDICILDIMMPGMDGFTLAKKIKNANPDMPFLFLTAKSQKEDKIKGLKIGADDYICKPFEVDELILRVKNILKRTGKIKSETYALGKVTFSFSDLQLICENEKHSLTLKEAELLRYLIRNKNKVLKREVILSDLWGENDYFLGRSMDVFISRIRKYLRKENNIRLDTIRGVGFILKFEAEESNHNDASQKA
jgi:DNA-binding response OmpR family regulator